MGDYENAVELLREQGLDDLAEVFDGFSASALRKKASKADELERELAQARAELDKVQSAPVIEKAFREAGVNFEALRPADREIIANLRKDELDDDKVAEVISRYEFPLIEGAGQAQQDETPPAAAAVVDAARQAPASTSTAASAVLRPEDVADWPVDKLVRLHKAHPEEYEALKRGESVTGLIFT